MDLSTISGALKNRFESQIIRNYFLSLSLLNWKVPVFLFTGSIDPEKRIQLVSSYTDDSYFGLSFLYAIVVTLFYIYIFPLLEIYLKEIKLRITIFIFHKSNEQQSKMVYQSKYGVDVDRLGFALKRQLENTNFFYEKCIDLFELQKGKIFPAPLPINLEKQITDSKAIIQENNIFISKLSGLFQVTDHIKPIDIVINAQINRENQIKK